jgi:hypothetical protein
MIDMRGFVAYILGLGLAANGLAMLAVPMNWYATVPGVVDTGPFNPHFVSDIGAAYVVAGAALVWFAKRPTTARSAAQAGASFLLLHAGVHLWDGVTGREHARQLLVDIPTVFLPPVLALWIAWSPLRHGAKSKKEKSDDQMDSAAVDRQVRAHVEL